ncbi:protein kinase [Streptomyces sp. 378]|uniref:serine/threonine-protein kinase n=1 Tax=Streptomyces sp. 378 TaxID=3049412 RepID=UPI0024C268C7|nr:serine/threonine-protein kinase [Streptomyces sp. 378]MDK1345271.1 protein kinase [Streptomyces sp. 378]
MVTGRYRLVESIGQGGMGRVWRAADEILDRQVAVKEMRIDGLDAEDSRTRRERTLREARATARIDHPNVVRVYDVVDEGERLWIVMELVAGRSLERILAETGPLSPGETARIGLGLVAALRQVHERGVLHRDIKPGNVLVEHTDGSAGSTRGNGNGSGHGRRVVLTDFGIAAIQDTKALTMVGMLVGSPDYMAPERISGRPQGPPSDIWSLGATLCAALGGRSPFSRDTTLATLHAVLYEEPELPAAAGPLLDILTALLAKEPSARPDLETLETALEPVAYPAPTPTVAVGPRDSIPEPEPAPGPHTTLGGQQPGPAPQSPPPASPRESPTPDRLPAPRPTTPGDPRRPAPGPDPHCAPTTPAESAAGARTAAARSENRAGPTHRPGRVSLTRAQAETEHRPHPAPVPMPPGELPGPAVPATPRPGRRPGAGRRRVVLTAAAATLATAGTVVGILLASSPGSPGDDDTPRAGSSASAPATTGGTTASPTVEGTTRPRTLPPGTRREAGGFAWAPPEGWRRDVKTGAEVHYTSPDGSQELVGKSSLARGDLLETWQTSERNAHQGQGYRKIRLEETTFRGHPAVVWEYTFTLEGVHWHARLLGFNVTGTSYQVNTWYEEGIEQEARDTYEKVKDGFTVL